MNGDFFKMPAGMSNFCIFVVCLNPINIPHIANREASGKTQAQVAKEANIAERAYQNYEYDKREPSARTAIRIARALNSTVEELFGEATPDNAKEPDSHQA